jgi:hypothetical protein
MTQPGILHNKEEVLRATHSFRDTVSVQFTLPTHADHCSAAGRQSSHGIRLASRKHHAGMRDDDGRRWTKDFNSAVEASRLLTGGQKYERCPRYPHQKPSRAFLLVFTTFTNLRPAESSRAIQPQSPIVAQDGQVSSSSSSRQSPLSEHMVDDSPIDTMQNDNPQPTAVSPMAASRTEESQTATSPTATSPTAPSELQSPQPGSEITRLASRATATETLKGSATSRSREFTSAVQKSPSSKDRPTSATKNTNERTWRHPDQLANQWIWELLSCCVSLLCLVAIIAVLAVHHSRPLPQ